MLKVLTFPLTLVTLGLFWLVINGLMLELASALLSPGFQVRGFLAAFVGAIVLSLVNLAVEGDSDAGEGSTVAPAFTRGLWVHGQGLAHGGH